MATEASLKSKRKYVSALLIAGIVLFAALVYILLPSYTRKPPIVLPEDYVIFVQYPENDGQRAFVAALAPLAVRGGEYHPIFVLNPDGSIDSHILWTMARMNFKGKVLAFISNQNIKERFMSEFGADVLYDMDPGVLSRMAGFHGTIKVRCYEEALWAAPLAAVEKKLIIPSTTSTYGSQEVAWAKLKALGLPANYVVVTSPMDWGNATYDHRVRDYHIRDLSLMAPFVAAYHHAYVLTSWQPSTQSVGYMDTEINARAIGLYLKLKEMNKDYGPIEYVNLIGSAAAVPQFSLPDTTSSDPQSCEGDGLVSSDVIYGFLTDDPYHMSAAVGRMVNRNLPSLSNMVARTFCYNRIAPTVTVVDSTGREKEVEWRTHASIWNGYEVADERLQMTPGWFAKNDLIEEGYTYDYMRTTGNEGWRDAGTGKERDFRSIMESSGLVFYRGHGSWHATFYVWKPSEYQDPSTTVQYRTYIKDRLEGNNSAYAPEADFPSVSDYYLPPQVMVSVCCENAKIESTNFVGTRIDLRASFPLNYLYAGGLGLISATEVSFSNLGQDIDSFGEEYLPGIVKRDWSDEDYEWDMNNFWYAAVVGALLDHETEYGTIGKALQWGENRYMRFYERERGTIDGYPKRISPLVQEPDNPYWQSGKSVFLQNGKIYKQYSPPSTYWKEVAMFVCYGDPAFAPYSPSPGPNSYNPWHNGPEDM